MKNNSSIKYIPDLIRSQHRKDLNNYISPIFCGGLGNNLFQMATAISYSIDSGFNCIFGYWSSYNSISKLPENHNSEWAGKPNPFFSKWAGWKSKNDFNLKDLFPKIEWFDNLDCTANGDFSTIKERFEWGFDFDTGTEGIYKPLDILPGEQFYGYFFNKKYWHHNRNQILDILAFDPHRVEYVKSKYSKVLTEKPTVSLNLRIIDKSVASESEMFERSKHLEQSEFIQNAVKFFGRNHRFIVTSSNCEVAKNMIYSNNDLKNYDFYFIDEDFDIQLIISTMCKNHILTNSTFSFWSCYLDKNMENSVVVFDESFETLHSKEMTPIEWIKLKTI